jgi:transcriptional regulator with XRE-family HTH domain
MHPQSIDIHPQCAHVRCVVSRAPSRYLHHDVMEDAFYKRLGEHISQLRKASALTQEDLSAASDLTTSYINKIEAGTRKPTLDVLGAIADALDVPMRALFPGQDEHLPQRLALAIRGLPEEVLEAVIDLARKLSVASAPKPKRRRRR